MKSGPILFDMLYLMACALREETPEPGRIARMDLAAVYRLSRRHSIGALIYMALEGNDAFLSADGELIRKWREIKERAIRRNMLFDAERAQILAGLEQAGIWYAPLKGIVLQEMYPQYGMREMSDNDILYDVTYQKELFAFMQARGYAYQADSSEHWHHDVFQKPPVYNFEMHKTLFGADEDPSWISYCHMLSDRLTLDGKSQYGRRMTDEDFYIHMTAHTYRHYMSSGIGLRVLADTYIYLRHKKDSLDWAYVDRMLHEMGIAAFEKQCKSLTAKLFMRREDGTPALTREESDMLSFFAGSGVHGTRDNLVAGKLRKWLPDEGEVTAKKKLYYLWRRICPDRTWFLAYEPFYARHRLLLPFFIVKRISRKLLRSPRQVRAELAALRRMDKKGGTDR